MTDRTAWLATLLLVLVACGPADGGDEVPACEPEQLPNGEADLDGEHIRFRGWAKRAQGRGRSGGEAFWTDDLEIYIDVGVPACDHRLVYSATPALVGSYTPGSESVGWADDPRARAKATAAGEGVPREW